MHQWNITLAAVLLTAGSWAVHHGDRTIGTALLESVDLRWQLQSDPVGAMTRHCSRIHAPQAARSQKSRLALSCQSTIYHRGTPGGGAASASQADEQNSRKSDGKVWIRADCTPPKGRPIHLEPVRFRKIGVCCTMRREVRPGSCLFAWNLVIKS